MTDLKLEVVVVPVSDVDRAKELYKRAGFREDIDYVGGEDFRVVQLTPPGSRASITVGEGVTEGRPGSARGFHLVVRDIVAERAELEDRDVEVSEVFHDDGGAFFHAVDQHRLAGPHPDRQSCDSFLSSQDPDGNLVTVQEVTVRHPNRIDHVVYGSVAELEQSLRDTAAAQGRHQVEIGHADGEWPAWYAAHTARAAGLGS